MKCNHSSAAGLPIAQIRTSRPRDGEWRQVSSVTYGGTTLYAPSTEILNSVVSGIEHSIVKVTSENLCLIRQVLKSYVAQALKEEVPEKLFSAVLGRCLRTGRVECLPCLTVNGKTRRIYICREQLDSFFNKVKLVEDLLKTQTAVSLNIIQTTCFPDRARGTWFVSQQVAEHIAYSGRAIFADNDLFVRPKIFLNAKRASK